MKKRDFTNFYKLVDDIGFLFNPIITYSGSFFLRTGTDNSSLYYDKSKDVFFLNSIMENGENKFEKFMEKYFINDFGNPPNKAIMPAIHPVLISEMNQDGHGRVVRFSYASTLYLLLEDSSLIVDAPDNDAELALYVKAQVKKKRDKMSNVLRLWNDSEYYEEMKERYESNGYKMTPEFLYKQEQYFTKLIFILKDIANIAKKNKFDKEKFEECFERDKLILMLCKCIFDSSVSCAKMEGVFHNCIIEVLQLINNLEEMNIGKAFNPTIKYYNESTKRVENYTFNDLRNEVGQMLAKHPEFEITTISMEDALNNGLVRNEEKTAMYSKAIIDTKKRSQLEADWEFLASGTKETDVTSEEYESQIEKSKTHVSANESSMYFRLVNMKFILEKLNYERKLIGKRAFAGYVAYICSNGMAVLAKLYEDEEKRKPISKPNAIYVTDIDHLVMFTTMNKLEIIQYIKDTNNPGIKRFYYTPTLEQRLQSYLNGKTYDAVESEIDKYIEMGKIRKMDTGKVMK